MNKKNILIVNDNKRDAEEIKTYLDVIGIKDCVSISSGTDALEEAVKEDLDLVIVNEKLNDFTGLDLCMFIRRAKKGKIKTILISEAPETFNAIQKNKNVVADKHVERTPNLEHIINAVRELIY